MNKYKESSEKELLSTGASTKLFRLPSGAVQLLPTDGVRRQVRRPVGDPFRSAHDPFKKKDIHKSNVKSVVTRVTKTEKSVRRQSTASTASGGGDDDDEDDDDGRKCRFELPSFSGAGDEGLFDWRTAIVKTTGLATEADDPAGYWQMTSGVTCEKREEKDKSLDAKEKSVDFWKFEEEDDDDRADIDFFDFVSGVIREPRSDGRPSRSSRASAAFDVAGRVQRGRAASEAGFGADKKFEASQRKKRKRRKSSFRFDFGSDAKPSGKAGALDEKLKTQEKTKITPVDMGDPFYREILLRSHKPRIPGAEAEAIDDVGSITSDFSIGFSASVSDEYIGAFNRSANRDSRLFQATSYNRASEVGARSSRAALAATASAASAPIRRTTVTAAARPSGASEATDAADAPAAAPASAAADAAADSPVFTSSSSDMLAEYKDVEFFGYPILGPSDVHLPGVKARRVWVYHGDPDSDDVDRDKEGGGEESGGELQSGVEAETIDRAETSDNVNLARGESREVCGARWMATEGSRFFPDLPENWNADDDEVDDNEDVVTRKTRRRRSLRFRPAFESDHTAYSTLSSRPSSSCDDANFHALTSGSSSSPSRRWIGYDDDDDDDDDPMELVRRRFAREPSDFKLRRPVKRRRGVILQTNLDRMALLSSSDEFDVILDAIRKAKERQDAEKNVTDARSVVERRPPRPISSEADGAESVSVETVSVATVKLFKMKSMPTLKPRKSKIREALLKFGGKNTQKRIKKKGDSTINWKDSKPGGISTDKTSVSSKGLKRPGSTTTSQPPVATETDEAAAAASAAGPGQRRRRKRPPGGWWGLAQKKKPVLKDVVNEIHDGKDVDNQDGDHVNLADIVGIAVEALHSRDTNRRADDDPMTPRQSRQEDRNAENSSFKSGSEAQSKKLKADLGLAYLADKTIRPRVRNKLDFTLEGHKFYLSEDGTEIHVRHYDNVKDFFGAKIFLILRWAFQYLFIPCIVFGYIIVGALVFQSLNTEFDQRLCLESLANLSEIKSEIVRTTIGFVYNASMVPLNLSGSAAAAAANVTSVNGFVPLPLDPPPEFVEKIEKLHWEYEKLLAEMDFLISSRHVLDGCTTEFWTFLESMLLAFSLCTTIGYGYITPNSPWGKRFLIFFSVVGVPLTVLMMNSMGNAMQKVVVKIYGVAERKIAKWRRRRKKRNELRKKRQQKEAQVAVVAAAFFAKVGDDDDDDDDDEETVQSNRDLLKYFFQVDRLEVSPTRAGVVQRNLALSAADARRFRHAAIDCTRMRPRESLAMLQIVLEEQEFNYLKSVWSDLRLTRESSERKSVPIWISTVLLLIFILLCSFVWLSITNWSLVDSIYFAFCTFTTVGFGDINPVEYGDETAWLAKPKIILEVVQIVMIAVGILVLSLCVSLIHSEAKSLVANMRMRCCPKKIVETGSDDDSAETDWESATGAEIEEEHGVE